MAAKFGYWPYFPMQTVQIIAANRMSVGKPAIEPAAFGSLPTWRDISPLVGHRRRPKTIHFAMDVRDDFSGLEAAFPAAGRDAVPS